MRHKVESCVAKVVAARILNWCSRRSGCASFRWIVPNLEGSAFEVVLEQGEMFVKLLPEGRIFDRDVGTDGILLITIKKQKQGVVGYGQ
jgi:hypothetical protein